MAETRRCLVVPPLLLAAFQAFSGNPPSLFSGVADFKYTGVMLPAR
jgi:hypothetical protein